MTDTNAYDEVLYPEAAYPQTHPNRLAVIARLLGLSPEPIENCRVLELGCASGANLIPMAEMLPESQFVGIDYAQQQVALGQAVISDLGLTNIQLIQMNILELHDQFGQFDYIIAHGLYSWIPANVRDKLIAICKQCLKPQGVAFISYNTYPGWHMLAMSRDIMRYRIRDIQSPQERIEQGHDLVRFLAELRHKSNSDTQLARFMQIYADLLKESLVLSEGRPAAAVFHDELETVNDPVYFHEFAAHLERHGLQYLSESEFPLVMLGSLPRPVQEKIAGIASNLIDVEQYMDFVRNRTFRQTLICHQDAPVNRRLNPAHLLSFFIISPAKVEPGADSSAGQFVGRDGIAYATDDDVVREAFNLLIDVYPRGLTLAQVVQDARATVYASRTPTTTVQQDAERLAAHFLQCFSTSLNLIDFRVHEPAFVTTVSPKPLASAYIRHQVTQNERVTNGLHQPVQLEDGERILLSLLDGTRDQAALVDHMLQHINRPADMTLEQAQARMSISVQEMLGDLAGRALLIG